MTHDELEYNKNVLKELLRKIMVDGPDGKMVDYMPGILVSYAIMDGVDADEFESLQDLFEHQLEKL